MSIEDFIKQNQKEICLKWEEKTLSSYSDKTSSFFLRDKNRFSNPVGNQLRSMISACVQYLTQIDASEEEFVPAITEFIKIRAVQDFKPSEAVGFIFLLKDVLRKCLSDQPGTNRLDAEWVRIESKIDRLTGLAFDIFVESRQKIYDLRIGEIKRTGYRLLKKANLIGSDQEIDPQATGGGQ